MYTADERPTHTSVISTANDHQPVCELGLLSAEALDTAFGVWSGCSSDRSLDWSASDLIFRIMLLLRVRFLVHTLMLFAL